jgi:RES domain-containing protein
VPVFWRIATDTPIYSSDDLSGKGAESTGGRWNRKGIPLTYASQSIALACLETMVHLSGMSSLPLNRYLIKVEATDEAWNARTSFDATTNVGWDALPAGLVSIDWGTEWATSLSSLIAVVPSVIVPEECNVLLNPAHPDVSSLRATKVRKWTYDNRVR